MTDDPVLRAMCKAALDGDDTALEVVPDWLDDHGRPDVAAKVRRFRRRYRPVLFGAGRLAYVCRVLAPVPHFKPTIPSVVALFAAYHEAPGNGAWGSLHVALDDGNLDDGSVLFCRDVAREDGDTRGYQLAFILLGMSKSQRRRLNDAVNLYQRRRHA